MAQVGIRLGGLIVEIEDEDSGFKPLARKARALVVDLMETAGGMVVDAEDDEEIDDGE